MGQQFLRTNQLLMTYTQPDTLSEEVDTLVEGEYEIIEVRKNHPTPEYDFLKVKNIDNQDVWVCLRSQAEVFGDILTVDDFSSEPDSSVSSDPDAINESFLIELLPHFADFTYHLKTANYPFELIGVKLPQAPPASNNCCTFVEALTVKAWQNAFDEFPWDNAKHGQMMILSTDDYFSPVTCLVQSNMASAVDDEDAIPKKWSVIQGWRKEWSGGHTFIILDHHEDTDRVLTLESNKAFGLDGVGYRNLGNYRDVGNPTGDWWANEKLPTWTKLKSTYKFRNQCTLKVKNLDWI